MGDTVALIGLGLLGSALNRRGFDVAPDRLRQHTERGGFAARSPADAARGATVVMTCLMTADIVRDVLLGPDGALEVATPGVVVIDCSTIHPDASAALAAELGRRGIAMLDAPVGGSSGQARRREAPVVVGGDRAVFERGRPFLGAIAQRARITSARAARAPGRSSSSTWCLGSTAWPWRKASSSACARASMDVKGERMLDGDYEPEGKLAQHLKDVELMLEVGHAAGAPLLATALHRQLLLAGVAGGRGERDNSSIMAVLRALIAAPR